MRDNVPLADTPNWPTNQKHVQISLGICRPVNDRRPSIARAHTHTHTVITRWTWRKLNKEREREG